MRALDVVSGRGFIVASELAELMSQASFVRAMNPSWHSLNLVP
jgi:hypothetical protein